MSQLSRSSILCIPLVLGQYRLGSSYSFFGIYPLSFLSRHSNSLARLCGDFTVGTSLSAKGKGRGTPKWRYLLACREGVSYSMGEVLALSGEGANSASTGIKICRANGLRDIRINDSILCFTVPGCPNQDPDQST